MSSFDRAIGYDEVKAELMMEREKMDNINCLSNGSYGWD